MIRPRDPVRRPVLLTVSGVIPAGLAAAVEAGRRPRPDYLALAPALDADLLDVTTARAEHGRVGRIVERLSGSAGLLAWSCFRRRRRYEVVFTDGEQVGLPFAALCRLAGRGGSRHVMIVHVLSVRKKELLLRGLHLVAIIDRFIVYCTWQRDHLQQRLGARADQLLLTSFTVDADFFRADAVASTPRRMICSAGLERRDYGTLMAAVEGLDVEVVIAAASPWSKWEDSSRGRPPPDNVVIQRLDLVELRQVYADAQLVVMPLTDVDFQAGITTILEAMAMSRAVICTRTRGQMDTIEDEVTGRYVAPSDVAGLQAAIIDLLDDPRSAQRLGDAGRAWIESVAALDRYVDRVSLSVSALRVS